MKRLAVIFVLCMAIACSGFSQNATIKGTVIDTVEKTNIANSVITLLRSSDSVLVKFTRSDKDGKFILSNIPAGRYIVVTSYYKYADYIDELTLGGDSLLNMGNVVLTPAAKLLEAVVVRQNMAIRIKGDTIEYRADSFKVSRGATVEELLKRLPGFQVNKNGQVTAQGKTVTKILVDGEEFFTDDPAMVTQNLRADFIEKVQTYEKKSEQAAFTGIDDGEREKTVNLVLKENKKAGYFGKVSGGAGTDERKSGEAMLNYFRGKKKVAGYGVFSNLGQMGLNFEDEDRYGSSGMSPDEGDVVTVDPRLGRRGLDDLGDGGDRFNGEGVPLVMKSGAHFSNKWNKDINHVNGNYTFKRMDVDATGSSMTKYLLPDSAYYSKESHTRHAMTMQQNFTGLYDVRLDSFSSIRFSVNGLAGNTKVSAMTDAGVDDEDQRGVNRNIRRNIIDADKRALSGALLWRQRLKKKGRTISFSASHKYSEKNATGFLFSDFYLFDPGGGQVLDSTIDQYKVSYSKTQATKAKLVLTERIGKSTSLELNYSLARNASTSDLNSYDKENDKYESLNADFSNYYSLLYYSNRIGATVQINGKKMNGNIGTAIGLSDYIQRNEAGHQVSKLRFTNFFPRAQLNYRISPSASLNISYRGHPTVPMIFQIQPVAVNDDPLNVYLGNPDLKQAFDHEALLMFSKFDMASGQTFNLSSSVTTISNAITNSQYVDAQGKRTVQYVNTQGNRRMYFNIQYGFPIKKPEISVMVFSDFFFTRNVSLVQNLRTINQMDGCRVNVRLEHFRPDKLELSISGGLELMSNKSSNNLAASNTLWSQEYSVNGRLYLSNRLVIGTECQANLRQKMDAFDQNNNVVSWNGNVYYKIFPNRNGEFRFTAFDILNQQTGFWRWMQETMITDRRYQVLRQYFLLAFTWNFSKAPKDPATSK